MSGKEGRGSVKGSKGMVPYSKSPITSHRGRVIRVVETLQILSSAWLGCSMAVGVRQCSTMWPCKRGVKVHRGRGGAWMGTHRSCHATLWPE